MNWRQLATDPRCDLFLFGLKLFSSFKPLSVMKLPSKICSSLTILRRTPAAHQ